MTDMTLQRYRSSGVADSGRPRLLHRAAPIDASHRLVRRKRCRGKAAAAAAATATAASRHTHAAVTIQECVDRIAEQGRNHCTPAERGCKSCSPRGSGDAGRATAAARRLGIGRMLQQPAAVAGAPHAQKTGAQPLRIHSALEWAAHDGFQSAVARVRRPWQQCYSRTTEPWQQQSHQLTTEPCSKPADCTAGGCATASTDTAECGRSAARRGGEGGRKSGCQLRECWVCGAGG